MVTMGVFVYAVGKLCFEFKMSVCENTVLKSS